MKIKIINGPNLNLLGRREPAIYGTKTYEDLGVEWNEYAIAHGVEVVGFQSNYEGALVDEIGECLTDGTDGIVINAAAYTHTSIAILDALKAVGLPAVEVHISDTAKREDFRKVSYLRAACFATVEGHGTQGYIEALDLLREKLSRYH